MTTARAGDPQGVFSWLHLTDLHAGQEAQRLWPTVEAQVIEDLRRVHERVGGIDAVIFTGDLVYSGREDELALLEGTLGRIEQELAALGSDPVLLAIPGNHDLARPEPHSGVANLVDSWARNSDLQRHFWNNPDSEYRRGVAHAFEHWQTWWNGRRSTRLDDYVEGQLPGDYRATLVVGERRIGVIALNSAFLQLRGGDLTGRLSVDLRQLDRAFPDGIPSWAARHDLVLLLTHHPVGWLDKPGKEMLQDEIAAAAGVSIHLQGHQHTEESSWTPPTADRRLTLLGRSLFGLETFEREGRPHERLHGYQAGQVAFGTGTRTIRLWPRVGVRLREGGGWQVVADPKSRLEDDEGTVPQELGPSLREREAARAEPVLPSTLRSRLDGWVRLNAAALDELATPLSDEQLTRFYDGAMPRWSHAADEQGVPRRAIVARVVAALEAAREAADGQHVLLVGPGAEGKSTALLQAAATLVADPRWKVMWCPDPAVGLDSRAVANLPPGPWLLVVDDAPALVKALWDAHQACRARQRGDVHFLLAARDTDWKAARGDQPAWGAALAHHALSGLTAADARLVVQAWQRVGASALRELEAVPGEDARVERLLALAHPGSSPRGSFFGGVLHTRFTAEDLRAHLQEVMNRIGADELWGAQLRRALVAVAACDAVGIDGIDRTVLADLLAVPRGRVSTTIVRPLGEEAASTAAGRMVRIRHIDIARAIVAIAEHSGVDDDLGELYASIVRRTIRARHSAPRLVGSWLGSVLNIGPAIVRGLPESDFDRDRRLAIALRAAETTRDLDDERPLTSAVTHAATLRVGGRPADGRAALAALAGRIQGMSDHELAGRSFFYEWSVCAGEAGDPLANVVLSAYSISDELNPVEFDERREKTSLAGLGFACITAAGALDGDARDALARGAAACGFLGKLARPDPGTLKYFQRYLRDAAAMGAAAPADVDEAIARLAEAAQAAAPVLEDTAIRALAGHDTPGFEILRTRLARRSPAS